MIHSPFDASGVLLSRSSPSFLVSHASTRWRAIAVASVTTAADGKGHGASTANNLQAFLRKRRFHSPGNAMRHSPQYMGRSMKTSQTIPYLQNSIAALECLRPVNYPKNGGGMAATEIITPDRGPIDGLADNVNVSKGFGPQLVIVVKDMKNGAKLARHGLVRLRFHCASFAVSRSRPRASKFLRAGNHWLKGLPPTWMQRRLACAAPRSRS